jgi:hypothetical protein
VYKCYPTTFNGLSIFSLRYRVVLARFLLLLQNIRKKDFERKKGYFGSWFQRSHSWLADSIAFRTVVKQNIMVAVACGRGVSSPHESQETKKEKGARVPISPSRHAHNYLLSSMRSHLLTAASLPNNTTSC